MSNINKHIGFIYPLTSHEKHSNRKCTCELMEWLKAIERNEGKIEAGIEGHGM